MSRFTVIRKGKRFIGSGERWVVAVVGQVGQPYDVLPDKYDNKEDAEKVARRMNGAFDIIDVTIGGNNE